MVGSVYESQLSNLSTQPYDMLKFVTVSVPGEIVEKKMRATEEIFGGMFQ